MILEIQHETRLEYTRAGHRVAGRGAHGAGQRRRAELPLVPSRRQPAAERLPLPGRLRQPRAPLQPAGAAPAGAHPRGEHRRDRIARRGRSTASASPYPIARDRARSRRARLPAVPRPGAADAAARPAARRASPGAGASRWRGWCCDVADYIHTHFQYARDVTLRQLADRRRARRRARASARTSPT